MANNPSENILDEFMKTNKKGLAMENLNADFLQYSVKIIKRFVRSS